MPWRHHDCNHMIVIDLWKSLPKHVCSDRWLAVPCIDLMFTFQTAIIAQRVDTNRRWNGQAMCSGFVYISFLSRWWINDVHKTGCLPVVKMWYPKKFYAMIHLEFAWKCYHCVNKNSKGLRFCDFLKVEYDNVDIILKYFLPRTGSLNPVCPYCARLHCIGRYLIFPVDNCVLVCKQTTGRINLVWNLIEMDSHICLSFLSQLDRQ